MQYLIFQAKTCCAKLAEMEIKLQSVQEQLQEITCREQKLQHQLSAKVQTVLF